jgi:nucleoid-associated protein EbfC
VTAGGQPNMQDLLKQAQQMQQDLLAAQEELAQARVEGSAGGGLVTASVTGAGELVALTIDPRAVDPEDTETLADLVLAAVRDANHAAAELQRQIMDPFAQALGGGLGGGFDALGGGLPGPGGGLPGPGGVLGPPGS